MAGEKVYRLVGGVPPPVEIPARDPGRRYWMRRIDGEVAYLELTDAEEAQRDAEEAAPPPEFGGLGHARALRVGQSVPSGAETFIEFDTVQLDKGGYHGGTAHPDRFTVPTRQSGVYDLRVFVRFREASAGAGANVGDRAAELRAGPAAIVVDQPPTAPAPIDTYASLAPPEADLVAGNILRVMVRQTSGADMLVDARISLRRLEV